MKLKDQEISDRLVKLYNKHGVIDREIRSLVNEKTKRKEAKDRQLLKSFPKNVDEYTADHWRILLSEVRDQSMVMYKHLSTALEFFNLFHFGRRIETNQASISLNLEYGDPEKFKKWFLRALPVLKCFNLKADYRTPPWEGVWPLLVSGLEEDTKSVAYIDSQKPHRVLFYKSEFGDGRVFQELDKFIEYLNIKKRICDIL